MVLYTASVRFLLLFLISGAHATPVANRQSNPDVLIHIGAPRPPSPLPANQSFRASASPIPGVRSSPPSASPPGFPTPSVATGWYPWYPPSKTLGTKPMGGLNTAAVTGIVVGVVLLLSLIALVWWLSRKPITERTPPARPPRDSIGPYGTPEIHSSSMAVMAVMADGVDGPGVGSAVSRKTGI